MPDIVIRNYQNEDRQAIRDIAFNTALVGEPATEFLEDKEMVADILTAYFTDREPESCFVAETGEKVAGYITGAKNAQAMHTAFSLSILPRILARAFTSPVLLKKGNRVSVYNFIRSVFKGEFHIPDIYKEYPAMLHINIAGEYRGRGIGAKLMSVYLEYLKSNNIPGVHLVAMSEEGAAFFRKEGFELLSEHKRSCFRHVLHRDVPVFIYGKRITSTALGQG
jgi:ribosomal protein S18 acetylase RimI-like enzyme